VITVDSEPARDRINHLQSVKDRPNQTILVRDTLSDGSTQNAVSLDVRRVAGPHAVPRWQKFGPGLSDERIAKAMRAPQIAKLSSLRSVFPHETAFVTDAGRKAQLAARVASWNRLLTS
jgi:hypothetical protein